ncbi:MAG: family serine peptidase [Ignavibacteria bacterium]|nr:family serine peptidase [Ignavibacteria bacterium]
MVYTNSIIKGATNQYYTPNYNGIFEVDFTDSNGCSSMSEPYDFKFITDRTQVTRGILNLYPNPSTTTLNIGYTSEFPVRFKFKIITVLGKTLFEENVSEPDGTYQKKIDISKLAYGMYLIILQSDSDFLLGKFVVNE